jgi:antagonist of KipI
MIHVEYPGLLSTLQDGGRPGWQHLGITPGGVMDVYSARIANALVGNPHSAAVLETTLHAPCLSFAKGVWLAITGADLSPEIDGAPVPSWRPVWVPAGSRLRFGLPRLGCRAYLAVAGGFVAPRVLNGSGTDCRAGFGGLEGRPLRAGDRLEFLESTLPAPDDPQRMQAPKWCVGWSQGLPMDCPARLRLIPGPDWAGLPLAGRRLLAEDAYRISAASDRMGMRLEGPPLSLKASGEKLSAGVTFGTLQLPPGGQPILLGVDRQTTGGYPMLGVVASVDHPRLAQLRPGDPVRIEPIAVEQAQKLYRLRDQKLRHLQTNLGLRWPLSRKRRGGGNG